MKRIIFSVFIVLLGLEIKADIAPDPIKAKGIAIYQPTEIKLTYEKVVVNLTLDSSFVHCYFKLHNEGKARKIQIGYPNMSYYSNNDQHNFRFNPINVFENGKKIDDINFFSPDSINLRNNDNNNKPWYLWDTYFDENETRLIVLSYSLPHGIVKNNLYYKFDYLLSTGAGWKGDIDSAEIIINLKNFDKDLILKTSPKNFTSTGNQIGWKLYAIEPTLKDDISICYEKEKGQYGERLKQTRFPVTLFDNNTILSNDIRDVNVPTLENLNLNEIASLSVLKASESVKMKFPNIDCSNGLILIYSKRFAINKLLKIIKSRSKAFVEELKSSTISDFEENYSLNINDKIIKKVDMTGAIVKLDENSILDISIKKLGNNQTEIYLKLK
jgi:hypothetical protein